MHRACVVLDIEKSLCGDCLMASVCFRLRLMDDLYDPICRFRTAVTECDDYKPWPRAQAEDKQTA